MPDRRDVQPDARVSIGTRRSIHAKIRLFGSSSRCVTVTPAYIAQIVRMQNDGVLVFARVSSTRRSSSGARVSEPSASRRSMPNVRAWRGHYRRACGGVTSAMHAIVDCPKRGCNILRLLPHSILYVLRTGWMRRHVPRLDTQHSSGSTVRLRPPEPERSSPVVSLSVASILGTAYCRSRAKRCMRVSSLNHGK
jgi:hypothetical protein